MHLVLNVDNITVSFFDICHEQGSREKPKSIEAQNECSMECIHHIQTAATELGFVVVGFVFENW